MARFIQIAFVVPGLLLLPPPLLDPAAPSAVLFTWKMEDRYGLDRNRDGFLDLPNTYEYAHNMAGAWDSSTDVEPRFNVTFDASPVPGMRTPTTYSWQATGPVTKTFQSTGTHWSDSLPEGAYSVTLTVSDGTLSASTTRTLAIEDILIVSIGDSYGSGEGNPDRSSWFDL